MRWFLTESERNCSESVCCSSLEDGGRTLGWVLTENFLEQGSLSCAFEEEEDSCRWGNGVQSTEAGMGGSRHMLQKSV